MLFITATGCGGTKFVASSSSEGNQLPPNVVFLLVDDLGWRDLGCYGSDFYETPNIDRLAARSTLFTDAYSAHPVCSPTRAALLTGRHPSRIGITDWIPGQDPRNRPLVGVTDLDSLPLHELTLAEALKEYDYTTFFAGKWHLGDEGNYPEDQGFDINKGGHHKGSPPGGYYSPYQNPKLADGPAGEYLTDRLTDESIQFMSAQREEPFLLYLSYYTVHTPIQACNRHLQRFEDKKAALQIGEPNVRGEGGGQTVLDQYNPAYASMVYALDENVGRLLDSLEAMGLDDRTLIVFTSDNGGLSTLENRRTAPTSVVPLRAGKGWAYEGGIRTPLLVSRPGQQTARRSFTPVISMDLFPTILQETGHPLMPDAHVDGLSLTPLLNSDQDTLHEVLFWDYPHYHGSAWTPGSALRKGDWKLVYFYETDRYELYHLATDLSEQRDLSGSHRAELTDLKEEMARMKQEYRVKMPTANVR
ncbi:arylsulfatase A-like enzyme [Lewinella aquimaris]|uniref:Arylsulfatase A-like enzyme n=1 Tax=Neolewinella aquimaris TaxID=1835722 RepID=A0A840E4L6_9BACT|nr:sulfatase [Neolewinella aquimaris]MBB4078047.1 arylsulfatase A-like enzyme [Neolewinella aquimaris]